MAEIVIVEQDRLDAENLLEQFLGDNLLAAGIDADIGRGSAMRDFAITAMSLVYAFMRKESDLTRQRQSLLLLGEDEGDEVDDAVDEILSNWFIRRKTGRKSRGVVTVYFNQATDVTVRRNDVFYKTNALPFVIDSDADRSYGEDDMVPVTDNTGVVTEYALRVPVIAVEAGANYDISTGPFVNFTKFSPYTTRVENTTKFSGGASVESTEEMLDRAPTAISVRDLNSPRSIDVVLKEEFTDVDDVTVIGFGDTEMIRDLIIEEATGLRIHAGGYTDAYLRSPISESEEFTGVVGAEFTDPRPGYYVLRDDTISDFTTLGIARGDVIHIYNNLIGSEANEYIVHEVTPYGVTVSCRSQFPMDLPAVEDDCDDGEVGPSTGATDRLVSTLYTFSTDDVGKWIRIKDSVSSDGTWLVDAVATAPNNWAELVDVDGNPAVFAADETGLSWELCTRVVNYSIGTNSPDYDNQVSRRLSGRFTKSIQRYGRVLLPAKPVYRITDVYIEDNTDPDLSVGGRITFPNRVNLGEGELEEPRPNPGDPLDPALLQYRVFGRNPDESFSGWQVAELQVNWDVPAGQETRFNGKTLHVVFDTLSGYDSIWEFMVGTDRRLTCASIIPKGMHPVYIRMNIRYKLAKTAMDTLDTDDATSALVEFINGFDTREDLDVSDVAAFLRENYDVIGYIEPITAYYELLSPDGRIIYYKTTDQIIIDPDKQDPAYSGYDYNRMDDPAEFGVSDNTVRYLTASDLITFEAV